MITLFKSLHMGAQGALSTQSRLWFLAALLLALAACQAIAQTGGSQTALRLTVHDSVYDIGSHAYLSRTPGQVVNSQTYRNIVERHGTALQGNPLQESHINLGMGGTPHWLIFSVVNNSWEENWVLSMGRHMDGRLGQLEGLFVYEHNSQRRYVNTFESEQNPYVSETVYNGVHIPVKIPRGEQALFVVHALPQAGSPVVLAPRLVAESHFYSTGDFGQLLRDNLPPIILALYGGFFIALLLVRRFWASLYFIAYGLLVGVLFYAHDLSLVADQPFTGALSGLLLALCMAAGLIGSKFFLQVNRFQAHQSRVIYMLMAVVLLLPLTAFLVMDPAGTSYGVLMYVPSVVAMVFLTLLSLSRLYEGNYWAAIYGLGWAVLLLSCLLAALALINFSLVPTGWSGLIWGGFAVQMLFFVLAVCARLYGDANGGEISGRSLQDLEETVGRMRQTKEAAENARLLRMIEHERQVMNELREREIAQSEEMKVAKEEADLANRSKSAFLAVVSHEIRTPMTGIMGMVRLLLETVLDNEQKRYAQTIQDSGDAMMALLNDILDFEKIESDKMDLEHVDFDLHRLIEGVRTLMSGHAEAKNIALKVDMDPAVPRFVIGDPVRLRQVLLNLVGNSIKFTSEGGVTLHIQQDKAASGSGKSRHIRFSIEDTGVGISEEAQKNLFNPFSQADSSVSRKFGGTGLGLAISQKLIAAMGGKIAVSSTIGHGSAFFFTLVMEEGREDAAEEVMASQNISSHTKQSKSLRILIVEDNEINQRLMKELIERMGHVTSVAGSGEEGIDMLRQDMFDMILMDIQLPGITGMGATKTIRAMADRDKAAIPVIALTGNVHGDDIRQCYAANMNGHLAKPVDPKKLRYQLEKVIDGKLDNPVELADVSEAPVLSPAAPPPEDKTEKSPTTAPVAEGKEAGKLRLPGLATESDLELDSPSFEDDGNEDGSNIAPIKAMALDWKEKGALAFSEEELDEDSFADALSRNDDMQDETAEKEAPGLMGAPETNIDPGTINNAEKSQDISSDLFDLAMISSLYQGLARDKFDELISGFLETAEEILQKLSLAREQDNMEEINARAHELKGMAGNFGFQALSHKAALLESASKNFDNDKIGGLVSDLPALYEESKSGLKKWLSEQ